MCTLFTPLWINKIIIPNWNWARILYMQSISFILKRKCVRMVPKVRVGKMKIKTWNVRFFKCSSSKKARAVILEHCVGTIYSIVKFEYQRSTILIEGAFEKMNIPCFYLHFTDSNFRDHSRALSL